MTLRRGTVRAVEGGIYEVELEGGAVVEARLRGRIKRDARSAERVVAGDRVELRLEDGSATANIERVEERVSVLARRAPGGRHRPKPIVANVDLVAPVFAAADPAPKRRMLDRFLVLAESSDLPALIIINKVDLVDRDELHGRFADYEAAGYPLILTSVNQAIGLDELGARLCGRVSVLTGPSGVGKSSLLNALEPGLGLRIGEVSEAVGKGRHTTVTARLVPLGCGGYVADTPGLREVGLWDVPSEHLDQYFPEFRPYLGNCRFGGDCSHTHEPGCGVREAVAAELLSADRYQSYRDLLEGGSVTL